MQYDHYESAGPVYVRMAGAPRTRHVSTEAASSAAYIRTLASDPLLREAVQVASSSLANSIDRLDSGTDPSIKQLTGTALSLTRYALRHRGRPTPFGLFAGVTTAQVDAASRVELRGPGRKAVRLDGAWLDDRIRQWLEDPEVRSRVNVVVSDLCYIRGVRLLLPTAHSEISVRHTALVAWACEAAAAPIPYGQLLEKAVATFPDAPGERIDGALAQLLRHGFLLSSLDQPDFDGRTLARVEAAVESAPTAVQELHGIQNAIHAYERTPPGAGHEAWRNALRAIGPTDHNGAPPIQVDLHTDADIRIPPAVIEEARRYASAMWTISHERVSLPHMREYCDEFIERYGAGAQVPLGELVDPHRGLGFPDVYRSRTETDDPPPPDFGDGATQARRQLVSELMQEALAGGSDHIALDDEVLSLLAVDELSEAERATAAPQSLELCFQLLADSTSALDRGEFALVKSSHQGSWTAGATAGRFAELTNTTDELARLLGQLDDGRTLPAQVVFRPRTTRALNPLRVPQLLPHRIPVGVYSDPDQPGHLDWRRLLVGVDPSGMRLTDHRTGRRVLPVIPHLISPQREAPNVARLLFDIGVSHGRVWTGWDWYGLQDLPFLPRVTFGKVTICPKRWLPDRHLRASATDPGGWDGAVAQWREHYRVPEHVQIVRGDRGFGIDLTDSWHRALLRHEVRTGGAFAIIEDRTADGRGLGWSQGHTTEVLIPLIHRPPASSATPVTPALGRTSTRHLPGEDWLYAKLYATEDSHNELLGVHLPPLLRDIDAHLDRWFFIRYQDPDAHLRIRIHGDPEALRSHVMPELARHVRAWQDAGVIRRMTLETYEPETDRYGGPEALPHAERLFHLDSRSVLGQLGLRPRDGSTLPGEVLAAANHAMLLESLGDWDWCAWVDGTFPKGLAHATFQQHRAVARKVIVPGRAATSLAEHFAAPGALKLWADAPEGRAYGDLVLPHGGNALLGLLHMQHNRLLGIDRDREERGYAILRGIARETLGRRRHTQIEADGRKEG